MCSYKQLLKYNYYNLYIKILKYYYLGTFKWKRKASILIRLYIYNNILYKYKYSCFYKKQLYLYLYKILYNKLNITLNIKNIYKYTYIYDKYEILLNYKKKNNFHISLISKNKVLTNLSLGLLIKFFKKGKFFKKKKITYLTLASLLRKIILFTKISKFNLLIKNIPVYFTEVLNILYTPSNYIYKNPFFAEAKHLKDMWIDEFKLKHTFQFNYFFFLKSKGHTQLKRKKIGRIKRKIKKKILLMNKVAD